MLEFSIGAGGGVLSVVVVGFARRDEPYSRSFSTRDGVGEVLGEIAGDFDSPVLGCGDGSGELLLVLGDSVC